MALRFLLCVAGVLTCAALAGPSPALRHGRPGQRHMRHTMMSLTPPEVAELLPPAEAAGTAAAEANCARGVCVLPEMVDEVCVMGDDGKVVCGPADPPSLFSTEYIWPRALLLGCSVLYGTNFPLGKLMNDALPASASTSARMAIAALALGPFLLKLSPALRWPALLCGCFTALGYISQSIALVDTPAATVAFLGALVVVVCPTLQATVDGRDLSFGKAPQVWIAAALCLAGVALLELGGGDVVAVPVVGGSGHGDLWSVAQAVGFGTSFFLTERMMAKEPSMALPITAAQVGVSAALSAAWATADGLGLGPFADAPTAGWLLDEATRATFALPGLALEPSVRNVALAAAWTGLITTAANRIGETTALGRVESSEASVLLATEPLWAAGFAIAFFGEVIGPTDAAGGALIIAACIANAAEPAQVLSLIGMLPRGESAADADEAE